MTIASIYSSQSHDISENLLSTIFQQLPNPLIMTGDFNSFDQIWGSPVNDNRGDNVLSFINKNQLNILNDVSHTRTSGASIPVIDLTIETPSSQPILSWNVTDSLLCSDHCTISCKLSKQKSKTPNYYPKIQHK